MGQEIKSLDREEIYSIDIKMFLEKIVHDFSLKAKNMNNAFVCFGLDTDSYLERTVNIDLDTISKSASNNNWYDIVKGFLNIWEFQFLYSITESTLKSYCKKNRLFIKNIITTEIIEKIINNSPEIINSLEENHNISKKLALDIWRIYTTIRNIYSHTHGILSEKDKKDIYRFSKKLRQSYDNAFHSDILLSTVMLESSEIFQDDRTNIGEFYFLTDYELNIFRNFVSEFIYTLSKTEESE